MSRRNLLLNVLTFNKRFQIDPFINMCVSSPARCVSMVGEALAIISGKGFVFRVCFRLFFCSRFFLLTWFVNNVCLVSTHVSYHKHPNPSRCKFQMVAMKTMVLRKVASRKDFDAQNMGFRFYIHPTSPRG